MLDKIDRKLLSLLQSDCTLSLQALADAVNLTTTPCWKRLKRLEDEGILLGRVALLDPEKLGLGLTAFVLIKTQHHSSDWYCRFVSVVSEMPEVLGMSDRIMVMHEGHLGGEFTREQATQEVLMAAAVGKLNRVNQE